MQISSHQSTPTWSGWAEASTNGRRRFGLELQDPFAKYILDGRKSIETRAYALPPNLLTTSDNDNTGGKQQIIKIDILESQKGTAGVSAIPNIVSLVTNNTDGCGAISLKRVGWCTFTESFQYTSREQFEADASKHLVDQSSGYGWSGRPIYGWVVGTCGAYDASITGEEEEGGYTIAKRRMRSLFELSSSKKKQPIILITGASGMLGRALHRHLLLETSSKNESSTRSGYNVIGTGHTRLEVNHYPEYFTSRDIDAAVPAESNKTVKLHQLDLLDFNATTEFLQKHNPDIIVHCAAERFPDAFEKNSEESVKLNVESTSHLARECKRLADGTGKTNAGGGPYLIYISTSYVFDGGAVSKVYPPYNPQSKANPINSYGQSKWDGECAVDAILNNKSTTKLDDEKDGGRGIIARVPLLYGEDCCDLGESPGLDMMKIFLPAAATPARGGGEATTKKKIDHWALRFPTSVEDVSRVLQLMIDKILENNFPSGTYHIASPFGTTKYELMKAQTKLLNIPSSELDERTEGNSGGPPEGSAPRPQCTQLDCSETWNALGMGDSGEDDRYEFMSIEDAMKRALNGFPERFVK